MTVNSSEDRFELPVTIKETDIDELGHVNNVVYLRWVQEVATAHWRNAATHEQQAQVVWVVVRHEIDYRRPARFGDSIIARTWVGSASEFTFERHTEIVRADDHKTLARAKTFWCPIGVKSGKPIRVGADIRSRFSTGAEHSTSAG